MTGARNDNDSYETPIELIRQVFEHLGMGRSDWKPHRVFEPGCSDNAPWLKVARETWGDFKDDDLIGIEKRDVNPIRDDFWFMKADFLTSEFLNLTADLICCNPPYAKGPGGKSLAEAFFKKCWKRLNPGGVIIWLCLLSWACRDPLETVMPIRVLALRKRPKFRFQRPNGEWETKKTDSREYGIFVYRKSPANGPCIFEQMKKAQGNGK